MMTGREFGNGIIKIIIKYIDNIQDINRNLGTRMKDDDDQGIMEMYCNGYHDGTDAVKHMLEGLLYKSETSDYCDNVDHCDAAGALCGSTCECGSQDEHDGV